MTYTDHEIVWRFDADCVHGEVVCHLPDDADCHQMPLCECEQYSGLGRDAQGVFFHLGDDGSRHEHKPGSECNPTLWLNEDDADIAELCSSRDYFEIGRTAAVSFVWTGEGYEWVRQS